MARLLLIMTVIWAVVIGVDYANHSQQMADFDSYSQRMDMQSMELNQ